MDLAILSEAASLAFKTAGFAAFFFDALAVFGLATLIGA